MNGASLLNYGQVSDTKKAAQQYSKIREEINWSNLG